MPRGGELILFLLFTVPVDEAKYLQSRSASQASLADVRHECARRFAPHPERRARLGRECNKQGGQEWVQESELMVLAGSGGWCFAQLSTTPA
jgi:hypothetical protein